MSILQSAQKMSHLLLQQVIHKNDIVVDATMGNGHDTLFLSQLVGQNGHVYAFDVQSQALDNTTQLLKQHNTLEQCHLILDGHEHLEKHLPQNLLLSAAIFNLGYLPKSDKTIITKGQTTIQALQQLLSQLKINGIIIIVVYYGHDGGLLEKNAIEQFVSQLSQKQFKVAKYHFLNQINTPPQLIVIEKQA